MVKPEETVLTAPKGSSGVTMESAIPFKASGNLTQKEAEALNEIRAFNREEYDRHYGRYPDEAGYLAEPKERKVVFKKKMTIYIASSWKNRHAVEMLTDRLRQQNHNVLSFIENEGDEADETKATSFDEWCSGPRGERCFDFDTKGATLSDLVIYIGPSGTDAWAEVGAAWASRVPIFALWAKGEQSGLMRRMANRWFTDWRELLTAVEKYSEDLQKARSI